jgi:hypothetical protein
VERRYFVVGREPGLLLYAEAGWQLWLARCGMTRDETLPSFGIRMGDGGVGGCLTVLEGQGGSHESEVWGPLAWSSGGVGGRERGREQGTERAVMRLSMDACLRYFLGAISG